MTGPRETRCVWVAPSEDPDARYLVPGCMERVQDWDAACTCKTTTEELDELQALVENLQAQLDRVRDELQALRGVVLRHRDAAALFAEADASFRDWRDRKAAVRDAGGEVA